MISKDYTYAIIGASSDETKYGHIVLNDLKEGGYKVVPINPKGGEILGLKVFPSVEGYQGKIDVAVFVVRPEVTVKVLPSLKEAGITKVWFQPGSSSHEAIEYCEQNGIQCSHHNCIMVARRWS